MKPVLVETFRSKFTVKAIYGTILHILQLNCKKMFHISPNELNITGKFRVVANSLCSSFQSLRVELLFVQRQVVHHFFQPTFFFFKLFQALSFADVFTFPTVKSLFYDLLSHNIRHVNHPAFLLQHTAMKNPIHEGLRVQVICTKSIQ